MSERNLSPPWDQSDELPLKPAGARGWGYMTPTGRLQDCEFEELRQVVGGSKFGRKAFLVWTPHSPYLTPARDIPSLSEATRLSTRRSRKNALVMAVLSVALWGGLSAASSKGRELFLVLLVVFGVIPIVRLARQWWTVRNRSEELEPDDIHKRRRQVRYLTWMTTRPANSTRILVLLLMTVSVLQLFSGWEAGSSVQAAGLLKGDQFYQEPWRALTGPLLHGGVLHLVFNTLALANLGAAVEAFADRYTLQSVFVVSMIIGSAASVLLLPEIPSVGASGGILGLIGFMVVFGHRRKAALPVPMTWIMVKALVLIAAAGIFAAKYIDNPAHAGGALAGLIMGIAIVSPGRRVPLEPKPWVEKLGKLSALVLTGAFILAAWKLLT